MLAFCHMSQAKRICWRESGIRGMTLTEIDIFSKGGAVRSLLAGLSSACGEHTGVALRWTEWQF